MITRSRNNLKSLYAEVPAGTPVTAEQLRAAGISADLAVYYARAGWLERLGHGIYCRSGEAPLLHPSLLILERRVAGLHVGGKTALEWYGVRQYASQRSLLHLYGWTAARLPAWFDKRFPSGYHRKRLFLETPADMPGVQRFGSGENAPRVSTPERALLELLDEVGVRQPLQEAREIAEGAYNLRANVLVDLLKRCTSVKTVRLCLQLGRELSLPWSANLDSSALPKGSAQPWISKYKDGTLVLKP